jgi:hypothetical protein
MMTAEEFEGMCFINFLLGYEAGIEDTIETCKVALKDLGEKQ